MKIKLILADDEELFRVGMSHILSKDPEIDIVFQASNGKELLEYLATCEDLPDMIIMDIKMPELNGVEATKTIHVVYPEISIIALTTYNTKPFIRNMIDVGAAAYLVKNSPTQKVLHTIKQVFYNGFYYDSHVMEAVKGLKSSDKSEVKTVFDEDFITQREKEVLELICRSAPKKPARKNRGKKFGGFSGFCHSEQFGVIKYYRIIHTFFFTFILKSLTVNALLKHLS